MKRSLRLTLLSILLGLTLLTVAGVGFSGYLNLRHASDELAELVVEQAAARVEQKVEEAVRIARRQTAVMLHMLRDKVYTVDDLAPLGAYWSEVVDSIDALSGIYFIRPDGTGLFVMRSPTLQRVSLREVRRRADGKGFEVATRLASRPGDPPRVAPVAFDLRTLPSWTAASDAKASAWTDTYLFFDETGMLAYPGLSYATPIRRDDGSLAGVLGVSFNVYVLCDYLKILDDDMLGYAFLMEQRRDGSRRLIAHPDKGAILEEEARPGESLHSELAPVARVKDPLVPALSEQLPPDLDLKHAALREVRFRAEGADYLGGWRGMGKEADSPPWVVAIVIPEDDVLGDVKRHVALSALAALATLLLGLLLSLYTSRQVAQPLEELAHEAEAIGRLDLDSRPAITSVVREVDRLARATEAMKTSLRSFRKYVPADLVALLLRSGQEAELGGEKRRLTIYFSDIANFTTISESMTPETLVAHLGEYLEAMSGLVSASGGTVDKYIGDAVMAFWGAPQPMAGHALAACTAAIRCRDALALRKKWEAEGMPPFHARVGIHTGDVVVGNIGSAARLNYTVIGDAVNLASRLEGINKYYGTAILISEETFAEAKDAIVARPMDWVGVKGKTRGVLVYELMGLKGETPAEAAELARVFGEALGCYRRQAWDEAEHGFGQAQALRPGDAPSVEMLRRCRLYRATPPGAGWDGVHRMEGK